MTSLNERLSDVTQLKMIWNSDRNITDLLHPAASYRRTEKKNPHQLKQPRSVQYGILVPGPLSVTNSSASGSPPSSSLSPLSRRPIKINKGRGLDVNNGSGAADLDDVPLIYLLTVK